MRKIVFIVGFLLVLLSIHVFSQVHDFNEKSQPSPKPITDCNRTLANILSILSESLKERNLTGLLYDVGYRNNVCNTDEYIFRARTLILIAHGDFEFFADDKSTLSLLLAYKRSVEYRESIPEDYTYQPDGLSLQIKQFDQETRLFAEELFAGQKPGSIEYLLCLFYANDFESFFQTIWQGNAGMSKLHKLLWDYRNNIEAEIEVRVKLGTGLWFPLGANTVLGVHPQFAFAWGIKAWIFQLDFSVIGRFADTPQSYTIEDGGMLYSTNYYEGGYVGADLSIDLFQFGIHEIIGKIGMGYDGFSAFDSGEHDDFRDIGSFSLHIGLEYRLNLFFNTPKPDFYGGYCYLENRYTFLNHQNENGTDLSGDAISTLVGIGTTLHKDKYIRLKEIYVY
jgi:hypothetical protein